MNYPEKLINMYKRVRQKKKTCIIWLLHEHNHAVKKFLNFFFKLYSKITHDVVWIFRPKAHDVVWIFRPKARDLGYIILKSTSKKILPHSE